METTALLPGVWVSIVVASSAFAARAQEDALAPEPSLAAAREVEPGVVPCRFEGLVLEAGGAPAAGALVVSSAGGKALTDESGHFELALELALGAEFVQVTAFGGAGRNALASARVAAGNAPVMVPTLRLATGLTCLPRWIPTSGAQPGADNTVRALALFDDGAGPKLYVGGDFQSAGGTPAKYLASWDGTSWSEVGADSGALDGTVQALCVFDDGSGPALYAAGAFTHVGGVPFLRIVRWDGSSWSALGAGLNGSVLSLSVFDDGHGPALYAAGKFTSAGGGPAARIARWDGATWAPLGAGIGEGEVRALAVFDDGSGPALYAGGTFFHAGGGYGPRVARWNGLSWTALGTNALGHLVNCLAVFDDGGGPKLYAGGRFKNAGTLSLNHVAGWDGASWSQLGSGTNDLVFSLGAFDDGSGPALYVGGSFTRAGPVQTPSLARWNGTSWSSVGGMSRSVTVLQALDLGGGAALFAGGNFTLAGDVGASRIARRSGGSWSALGDGVGAPIEALAVFDDGGGAALYAGGYLETAGGVRANRVVRWDGAHWAPLGSGANGLVHALAVFDGALYAGGDFTSMGGVAANRIARWNGTSWSALSSGVTPFGVFALEVFDDGSGPALYAGGSFSTAGGVPALCIARWNGASWSALGSGVNNVVLAMSVFDDGSGPALYVGGDMTSAGGVPASKVARWDGVSWSELDLGVNSRVLALTPFDDGTGTALYAGGFFTSAGGSPANRVARWDGASWSALGAGANGIVYGLGSFDDGTGSALYATGTFTVAGGTAALGAAKWNGASWSPLGGGLNQRGVALEPFDDGSGPALYVGGFFGSALDSLDSYLARWGCSDTQPPTISCPQSVSVLDRIESPPGEVVRFTVTASDDQDPAPAVVCVPPSGSFFPAGTTLVQCTATDASGNQATAEFPVHVASPVVRRP